jgi:hypothetical protein
MRPSSILRAVKTVKTDHIPSAADTEGLIAKFKAQRSRQNALFSAGLLFMSTATFVMGMSSIHCSLLASL